MTNEPNSPSSLDSPPPSPDPQSESGLAKFFKFSELKTTLRTEILAGITTFVTMAYILVVNPDILSAGIFLTEAGDLFGELVIATALSAAIASLFMGLYANYPFVLAPGMGLNAYFTFSVVIGLGIDWRVALAAVFVEGLIFIALTLANIRALIIKVIPECIKHSTAAGIGLFIAYIALSGDPAVGGAGIIVAYEPTKTALGDLTQGPTIMALIGILITSAFVARRVVGALLWGILATAVLGWIVGVAPWPTGIVGVPQMPVDLVGQAFTGLGSLLQVNPLQLFTVLLAFLFVDLFDTVGTLTGLGMKAGYIDENGELPKANKAFMADAIGTTAGSVLGTSTVTTYIESASGVSEGGRSGFTAIVAAILFFLAIFFIPLLSAIPGFATAPALLIVGVLMAGSLSQVRWADPAEAIPSFLTVLIMPLSYSIADGLAAGLVTYPFVKAFQGKAHEVSPALWVLAIIFILKFGFAR